MLLPLQQNNLLAGSGQTVAPTPVVATWSAPTPTVAPGAVAVSPTPTVATWSAPTPTVTPGAVTTSPTPTVATWSVPTPTVAPGAITLSPTPTAATWAVPTPVVSLIVSAPEVIDPTTYTANDLRARVGSANDLAATSTGAAMAAIWRDT